MKAIVSGFKFIIDAIKMVFNFIMDSFHTIGMVFTYLISVVDIAFGVIGTFPDWIKAFAIITIAISIAYFIIGRSAGKSD